MKAKAQTLDFNQNFEGLTTGTARLIRVSANSFENLFHIHRWKETGYI